MCSICARQLVNNKLLNLQINWKKKLDKTGHPLFPTELRNAICRSIKIVCMYIYIYMYACIYTYVCIHKHIIFINPLTLGPIKRAPNLTLGGNWMGFIWGKLSKESLPHLCMYFCLNRIHITDGNSLFFPLIVHQ